MENSMRDTFMEKLEEFVYDEDKTVTYTWLSTNLGIKVIEAEDLLEKYVREVRQTKPNDLSITYIILGSKNRNKISVTLSKESNLEENRSAFDHISSQHIYSIQKSKDADAVLFLVETLNVHNLREKPILGSIVGKNCVKRILKNKNIPVSEKVDQGRNPFFTRKIQSTDEIQNISKNGSTSEIFNKLDQKQNEITSFFSKAQRENNKDQKAVITKPKCNEIMRSFLKKGSVKTNSEENLYNKSDAHAVIGNKAEEVKDDVKTNEIEIKNEINKKESTKKSKWSRKNNKSEQAQKKRKRIIEKQDSDSDDIFGDDDENLAFEENESRKRRLSSASETGNTTDEEPSPVYEQLSKPVNKKRKQVTHTFNDEDEYMITKNEWVLEDESEDEEKENSRNKVQQGDVGNSAVEINPLKKISETEICIENEDIKQSKLLASKKDSVEELPPSKKAKKKSRESDKKSRNPQTLLNYFNKV